MRQNLFVVFTIVVLLAGCSRDDSGVPVSQAPAPAPAALALGGEQAANVSDGTSSSQDEEGNVSPEIKTVWFIGGDGTVGNTLGIEFETSDAGGTAVQVDIAWSRNGEPAGAGKYIPVEVRRDDSITVTLTPSTGKAVGNPVTLSRKITNSPPSVHGHDQFQFEGNVASFQMLASDVDGDTLSYALKDAPAGMTIDRNTGRIRWEVSPETTGKIEFTVEVSDGFGGSATAPLSITIAPQPNSEAR